MTGTTVQASADGALTNHRAPSYEVTTEHVIAPPARWFRLAGWKAAKMIYHVPSTPPGGTALVVLPDGIDYVTLVACDAIANLVREAGRVIVRGPDPTAVQMLEHRLRRATRTWSE